MAILSFDSNQKTSDRSTGETSNTAQRTSKLWLNIGKTVGDEFISFPYGLALDTMNERAIRGGNEEFNNKMRAGNKMLKDTVQQAFARLAPGESATVSFEMRLQRSNEAAAEIAPEDNEFTVDVTSMFG